MFTSLVSCLPYMPALQGLNTLSMRHLKNALDSLVVPGDIQCESTDPVVLSACRLMGGGVMLIAVLPQATVVRHDWAHVSALESNDVLANIVLEGSGSVTQSGVTLNFRSGDVFYRKARMPSIVTNDTACRFLVLRLSFVRFHGAYISRFQKFRPTLGCRDSPLQLALWHYAQHVIPALVDRIGTIAYPAEQAFISMLSAVYAESQAVEPQDKPEQSEIRWNQLVGVMESLLCEPELSVGHLAQALGVSPRLVHRLFAIRGFRYSQYLLEQRLVRAHGDLCNPLCKDIPIADIGYRVGFNNASHFSRCFKQRYGIAPSTFREGVPFVAASMQ
jgi:AraC-like DNA-binding protein